MRWRGAVHAAIFGKRGQAFLTELLAALDALPEKKLLVYRVSPCQAILREPSTAPRDCPSALDCSPNQPRHTAHRYISGGYIPLPWAWLIGVQTERPTPV